MSKNGKGKCTYCGKNGMNDTDPDICGPCLVKRQEFRAKYNKKDISNQKFTCLMRDRIFDKGVEVSMQMDITQFNMFFQEFLSKPDFDKIVITKHLSSKTEEKEGISK